MKKILCLMLAATIVFLAGCSFADTGNDARQIYQSYKEIPGVSQEETDAVEELLARKPNLIYGLTLSTEAFMEEDGSLGGFAALLYSRLSELFGFDFTPYVCYRDGLVAGIESKEIDFTCEFTATPERLQEYSMTEAIIHRPVKVFTNRNNDSLNNISKERPVRCAFITESTIYALVGDSWDIAFEPVLVNDESEIPDLFIEGKIDAYIDENVMEALFDSCDFVKSEEYYPLIYSPVSLTTANPELEPIISIVQKYLENGGRYELTELYGQGYKDYLKNKLLGQLTEEEKEYIRNHQEGNKPILAACEVDNYPTSFYNTKEKKFQGMALDVFDKITELTGLNIQVGNAPDALWPELLEGLESGKYSVCTELLRSSQREDRFLWADQSYCTSHYALLSKAEYPDVDINQIMFSRVGLMDGSAHADIYCEWFPDIAKTATLYAGVDEAFTALANGEIDLLMASQNMLLNLTNYREEPGFKANILFNYSSDSYFGFNKDEEILCSIMNKAQRYIDTEGIAESWQRKVFDYQSKMLRDMLPYGFGFTAVLLAALLVVIILFMKNRHINKNLDKTVNLRTNELESQAATLGRRLEQQKLMATLSQNFIVGESMDEKITESLRLTGEFLDVCRILLLKYEDQSLHYLYEWDNPSRNIKAKLGLVLPVSDMEMHLIVAYSQRVMSRFSLDDTDREDFIRRYGLDDIENFLMMPIYIGDEFWGVLEFDQCESYSPWSPSDINLGEMVGGMLSGVITRRQMDEELVQLSSIVENSPQFITIVRSGGGFAYYNPAAVEIGGYSREELDSSGLKLLLDSENYRRLRDDIVPIIVKNKKHTYELPFTTKGGETRVMSVSAFSLKSDHTAICSIASDITDLVMTQRELERQAAELALQTATISSMFASIPDIVFCNDLDLNYTRCNESFTRFFNCREEDVLGKNEEDMFGEHPKIAKKMRELGQKVIRENTAVSTEEYIPSASGEMRLFETIRTPLTQDGKPIGLIGISHDITQRKVAEETLKLTLDNLDACVYISEIETGEILFINKKMAEEYGDANCVGKICWQVLQKGLTEQCDFCPIPRLLASGDKDYVWEEHSTVTGKYYKNTDSLIKWHDGRLVHMQHSVDITDSILMRSELEAAVAQLEMVVKNYDGVIWSVDRDRTITLFDGLYLEKIGVTPSFLEGKPIDLARQKNRHLDIIGMVERTFESGPQDCISEIGDDIYKSHTTPVKDKDGNIICVVGDTVEMTEMIKLQNDLKKASEIAESASKAKGDFLSRMSHEIRTPLNAIIGMVNIAMGAEDRGKIQDCLNKADNASKHLLGVINDILDMSKIEADKFELDHREFNFEKMLMNVTNVTNFRAEEKKQNFIVNLNGNVPGSVVGDDLRLSQVITNLLTNAVKFTPDHGTVVLSIDKIEDNGGDVTLRVEVEDNGIGISEEQQKRLFTSFEQADGGIARRFGGTGLGLAISKRIVELMGGRIWIESELGKGSKFIFTMKAGKGKEKRRTVLSEKINRDNLNILAVDDSLEVREYFMHVMESLGLPCHVAASGTEALGMVKNGGDKPYNIFFIDWQMPEMNGIELTKRIKEIAPDNSVVFMISVAEWSAIEKEALAVGVRSFISKPLFPSTLVNAINECMEIEPQKTVSSFAGSFGRIRRNFSSHTILIAEDVEINREIMSAVLEETGINIDYAEDGSAAVSMFTANPGSYRLILMDIHMPEVDGYEATRRIRALELPQAKGIPIIAMTANVFREDIENCLAAGMNDHIGKPVDSEALYDKLDKYLAEKVIPL